MTGTVRLKAVVFDWAGTMIDFGSCAPMGAFVSAFAQFGVAITIPEARGPMGLPKRAHIAALLAEPSIAQRWREARGAMPGEAAIDAVFDVFVPLNASVVVDYADMIPGAVETANAVRARGLRVGSTTGYTRAIMAPLLPLAARQGYTPDNLVCAGDLADGRPTPLMMYRTFADLGVYPPRAVVKVDDTVPGIAEGRAAGDLDGRAVRVRQHDRAEGKRHGPRWPPPNRRRCGRRRSPRWWRPGRTTSSTRSLICFPSWTRSRPGWRGANGRRTNSCVGQGGRPGLSLRSPSNWPKRASRNLRLLRPGPAKGQAPFGNPQF
ncbi:MAG: phosphonoacetaldehyde hydrolase [Acetobacteraceae bacterium]